MSKPISILATMDERDIAQTIVMERMVHKGSFLLLEGKTDFSRFQPFITQSECLMVICGSNRKAKTVIGILDARQFKGALAILDSDFMRVRSQTDFSANVIRSQYHDLDLDWIHTECFTRYIMQVADLEKVDSFGGIDALLSSIHKTLRPVSHARYLGTIGVFDFRTSGIDVANFYATGADLLPLYCNALVAENRIRPTQVNDISDRVIQEMKSGHDDLQMSNGHDVHTALGCLLKNEISNRKRQQTYGKEVEIHIRLCFTEENLKSTFIYREICKWERTSGFEILKK